MAISLTATPVGTPADIIATIATAGGQRMDEVGRLVATFYDLGPKAGINPDAAIAQCSEETDKFRSSIWQSRLNPSGIGVTGPLDGSGKDYGYSFTDGAQAAQVHLVHLAAYIFGACPDALKPYQSLDPRWQAVFDAGYAGTAKTVDDLSNRWADDPAYGQKIATHYAWLIGSAPAATPAPSSPPASNNGGKPVADFTLYTFPGLKKQVPIPSWIKVVIPDPLPDGPNLTNHTKSNAFTKTTWHDTGNDTTKAADEYAWLKNGRPGGEPGDYSGIFDDTTIYITSRFDEDVWHAGTPEGNHTSYGFEQAFGGGVDFNKSLQVGAALHGGLIAALGWSVDTALVKHQYWYGKWCPGQILNKGIWSQVVAMVSDAALAAAAFLNGGTVPKDAPVYAKPVPIPELEKFKGKPDSAIPYRVEGGSGDNAWIAFYVGDRVQAVKATDRMRYSTGGEVIGAKLQPNEQFDVDWIIVSKAGKYADVYYTPWATRVRAADCQRVSDVKAAA